MSNLNLTLEQRLEKYNVSLNHAKTHPETSAVLAEFGYPAEIIDEGITLYNSAYELTQQQKNEYAEQHTATDQLNQARKEANEAYMNYVKIARVALRKDTGLQEKLDILGQRKQTFTGWKNQALKFYTEALANETIQTKLQRFGVTLEKLQSGKQLMDAVVEANLTQEIEKGEAKRATQLRDQAVDALDEWMGDFYEISKVALK